MIEIPALAAALNLYVVISVGKGREEVIVSESFCVTGDWKRKIKLKAKFGVCGIIFAHRVCM